MAAWHKNLKKWSPITFDEERRGHFIAGGRAYILVFFSSKMEQSSLL
jgi:hypothetical protein